MSISSGARDGDSAFIETYRCIHILVSSTGSTVSNRRNNHCFINPVHCGCCASYISYLILVLEGETIIPGKGIVGT